MAKKIDLTTEKGIAKAAKGGLDALNLELRLMAYNEESSREDLTRLISDSLTYVEKALADGKKKELLGFLNANKHRFPSDLKGLMAHAIKNKLEGQPA